MSSSSLCALFALYSPLAAVSSYFPVVARLRPADQGRPALGLFLYVTVFSLTALWVGEPLLELLGVSTAALTATGGIALLYAGVPLMRGVGESVPPPAAVAEADPVSVSARAGGGPVDNEAMAAAPVGAATPAPVHEEGADDALLEPGARRRFLFVPVTFPLTVGGTTFAFFVGFRAEATSALEVVGLSVAGVAYAALTGATGSPRAGCPGRSTAVARDGEISPVPGDAGPRRPRRRWGPDQTGGDTMPETSPSTGPVEWVALTFPGTVLDPAVARPIADLSAAGTVHILDAVVVHKAPDGTVTEGELEDEGAGAFDGIDGEVLELLSHADLLGIAERLEPDSTTLVLIWENRWATGFTDAVRRQGGRVLAHDRVPPEDVEEAMRAAASSGAQEGAPA